MLGRLEARGHVVTDDPACAEVIIVNTCGFISTASEEAVDVILQMAELKKTGKCENLIVTGCLVQRYKDDSDLVSMLPEVDAFLGTAACDAIADAVEGRHDKPFVLFPDPGTRKFQAPGETRKLVCDYSAYIKVSEGCSRHCTYCVIPELRGKQRSRPLDDIRDEAVSLAGQGVREIILTAENTTDYGCDLNDNTGFDTVLSCVSSDIRQSDPAGPDVWIRFLYTHPASLTDSVIKTVKNNDNICSYYDVPVQHASSDILKKMGRPYTRENLYSLFSTIREIDPAAALRTTLIVGFPGETDRDFEILMQFVKDIRFEHLGVFTYSDSHDLMSHSFKNHVPHEIAQQRHDMIMQAQAGISESINQGRVGEIHKVLVEENPEPGVYIGRTMFQAPEVDGVTFIYSDGLETGNFARVKITQGFEYDIAGEIA
jgi:ribosomal protein S12 methylthiotransferase